MNAAKTHAPAPAAIDTHQHVHWIDSAGRPCTCSIIRRLDGDLVLVRFSSLPRRCLMPRTMALPWAALCAVETAAKRTAKGVAK